MRSNGSHEASRGAPGVAPGVLARLIDTHLDIAENLIKLDEKGHDILVSGVPEFILGPLGSPLSSRLA